MSIRAISRIHFVDQWNVSTASMTIAMAIKRLTFQGPECRKNCRIILLFCLLSVINIQEIRINKSPTSPSFALSHGISPSMLSKASSDKNLTRAAIQVYLSHPAEDRSLGHKDCSLGRFKFGSHGTQKEIGNSCSLRPLPSNKWITSISSRIWFCL